MSVLLDTIIFDKLTEQEMGNRDPFSRRYKQMAESKRLLSRLHGTPVDDISISGKDPLEPIEGATVRYLSCQ